MDSRHCRTRSRARRTSAGVDHDGAPQGCTFLRQSGEAPRSRARRDGQCGCDSVTSQRCSRRGKVMLTPWEGGDRSDLCRPR
jgi:hypothetical protein